MRTYIKSAGCLTISVDCSIERLIETYIVRGFLVSSTSSFLVGAVSHLTVLMQKDGYQVAMSDCPFGEKPSVRHPDGLAPPLLEPSDEEFIELFNKLNGETESYDNALRKSYGLD